MGILHVSFQMVAGEGGESRLMLLANKYMMVLCEVQQVSCTQGPGCDWGLPDVSTVGSPNSLWDIFWAVGQSANLLVLPQKANLSTRRTRSGGFQKSRPLAFLPVASHPIFWRPLLLFLGFPKDAAVMAWRGPCHFSVIDGGGRRAGVMGQFRKSKPWLHMLSTTTETPKSQKLHCG